MEKCQLNFADLSARHPGISPGLSEAFCEAARVCLARHHTSPIDFVIERKTTLLASTAWHEPDDLLRRAWGNEIDATEAAAYCVALAAVEHTDGLVAIARAETLTGADYYLGASGSASGDLEASCRLEVSGTAAGGIGVVKARLRAKLDQASAGRSSLPAIAAVVGFASRHIMIAELELQ